MSKLYFSGDQGFGAPVVWGQPDGNAALAALFAGGYGQARMPSMGQPYEVMGAIEIIGDPSAPPAAKAAALSTLAAAALANKAGAVRVEQTMPERGYEQILPCTSLTITTATPRDITLTPQRTFKPTRFRASSTYTAPFFQINSYTIGAEPQFIAPGGVPCDLFSEVAFYSQTDGETANLGNIITLQVQNIDPLAQNRDFRAAFFGIALPVH